MRKTITYLGLLQQSNNIQKGPRLIPICCKKKGDTLLVFSNHFHNGYRVDGAQRLEESAESTARMISARIKKGLTKQKMFEVGFRCWGDFQKCSNIWQKMVGIMSWWRDNRCLAGLDAPLPHNFSDSFHLYALSLLYSRYGRKVLLYLHYSEKFSFPFSFYFLY